MEPFKNKRILISGASMAGLSTAHLLNKLGYQVTVVEMANEPRINGAAVDIKGNAINTVKRMEIFEELKLNRLQVERVEFKNAENITEGLIDLKALADETNDDELEIERDKFVAALFGRLQNNVEFIFNNSITALDETKAEIAVHFKNGEQRAFDLVLGCDGMHSNVRKIWFGEEHEFTHFLGAYFSITIVNKLLIEQKTMQMFNLPGRAITLNAYNGKTDIIFCFLSENQIPYNYRDEAQQRKIIMEEFADAGWRTVELMEELKNTKGFYFDKFCQIKMPTWTKGRVALIGDAGYCASPAAGMGASLAIKGASALADALQKHNGNFKLAFSDYNRNLRPFIEEIQAIAELNVKENFIPKTEEAIRVRNAQKTPF